MSSCHQLPKLDYSHQALADVILTNPQITRRELAVMFDRSITWMHYVMHSTAFQIYLEERKKELIDPVIRMTLEERLNSLAVASADILMAKLTSVPEQLADEKLAIRTLEISSKSLGYGARDRGAVNVQNNFVVAMPNKVESSEAWASQYKGGGCEAGKQVIDAVPSGV